MIVRWQAQAEAVDPAIPLERVVAAVRADPGLAPDLAGPLAHGRPVEALSEAVAAFGADPAAQELLSLWVSEAVVRGQRVVLAGEWRPVGAIGRLPLALTPVERKIPDWVAIYGGGACGRRLPPEPPYTRCHRTEPGLETLDGARQEEAERRVDQLYASEGARVYELTAPLAGRHPDRRLLLALRLEMFEPHPYFRRPARRTIRHYRITPEDAIPRLFAAASARQSTMRDGWGRVVLWDVVAALVGGDPADAMARAAVSDWWWVRFRTDSSTPWSYGFVVVSPERTRIGGTAGIYGD